MTKSSGQFSGLVVCGTQGMDHSVFFENCLHLASSSLHSPGFPLTSLAASSHSPLVCLLQLSNLLILETSALSPWTSSLTYMLHELFLKDHLYSISTVLISLLWSQDSYILLPISSWMSNRHLMFSKFNTELPISNLPLTPTKWLLSEPPPLSVNGNSGLLVL